MPANTYIASALAVSGVGAKPVFVDVDDAYLVDAAPARSGSYARAQKRSCRCTSTAKPYRWTAIMTFARRHGIRVVEDACQAHGARWERPPSRELRGRRML